MVFRTIVECGCNKCYHWKLSTKCCIMTFDFGWMFSHFLFPIMIFIHLLVFGWYQSCANFLYYGVLGEFFNRHYNSLFRHKDFCKLLVIGGIKFDTEDCAIFRFCVKFWLNSNIPFPVESWSLIILQIFWFCLFYVVRFWLNLRFPFSCAEFV